MNEVGLLLASVFSAGTVLALAGLGLLINEKAGVINLGAEGMMLCAALAGFAENSSFTRWFGKHFHQSPSSWRQQNLNRSLS